MTSHLPKILATIVLSSLVASCKIAVVVVEGGKVESIHNSDCLAGTICVIEVNDTNFTESFTAVPEPGWQFVRWNSGGDFVCAKSTNPTCALSNVGTAGISAIEAFIESEYSFYLMPVFSRGAPITDTVRVNDKEWAQVDLFLGITWNEIKTACPNGICNGALNGYSMVGWTWASDIEVGNLFVELGAPSGLLTSVEAREIDSSWAPAIQSAFRASNTGGSQIIDGASRTIVTLDNSLHRAPYVYDLDSGEEDVATISNPDSNSAVLPYKGAWFYRPAP